MKNGMDILVCPNYDLFKGKVPIDLRSYSSQRVTWLKQFEQVAKR